MTLTHSPSPRYNGSTFVELGKAYALINFAIQEGNENVEAFKDAVSVPGVLEELQTALSDSKVSFTKPNLCKKDIEKISRVEVAALTNSRTPKVLASTNLGLAEEFVLRSFKPANPSGNDRGERYSSVDGAGKITNWRVLSVLHEFGSIVAWFEDPDAKDYVEPSVDPVDDCGFTEECDDSEDECEVIPKYCMSRFRPAC